MNRNEMIKWLSENTNREQWVYGSKLQGDNEGWITGFSSKSGEIVVFNIDDISVKGITIDDVFEPVSEQPAYINGAVYEIGRENGKPRRFLYNSVTNSFNGIGFYCYIFGSKIQGNADVTYFKLISEPVTEQPVYIDGAVYEIGLNGNEPKQYIYNLKTNRFDGDPTHYVLASEVHDSKFVTHFKLVSEPERITDREAIDAIRREEAAEFMDSSAVTSEPQGLLNYPRNKPQYSAVSMLNDAAECIGDRAAERDTDNERSMLSTVNAFNAMYGTELTETQGWMFMVFLKASRAKQGNFREDDYTDGSSYFALAGECDGNVRR